MYNSHYYTEVTGLFDPSCSQNHGKEIKIERIKHFGQSLRRKLSSHASLIKTIRTGILR